MTSHIYTAEERAMTTDPTSDPDVIAWDVARDRLLDLAAAAVQAAQEVCAGDGPRAAALLPALRQHVDEAGRALDRDPDGEPLAPPTADVTDAALAADVDREPAAEPTQADALQAAGLLITMIGDVADLYVMVTYSTPARIDIQVSYRGYPDGRASQDASRLASVRAVAERLGVAGANRYPSDTETITVDLHTTTQGVPATIWARIEDPAVVTEARAWIAEAAGTGTDAVAVTTVVGLAAGPWDVAPDA